MATMTQQAAVRYNDIQISTAAKPKAVLMLHDACIKNILAANHEPDTKREMLNKAQNIITELQSALVISDSVSQSIFYLYDYCYTLLENGSELECVNAYEVLSILRTSFWQVFRSV